MYLERGDAAMVGALNVADLLVEHEPWLHGVVLNMARDPHVAVDITQEALARALARNGSFANPEGLRGWLRVVARNLWTDRRSTWAVADSRACDLRWTRTM